MDWQADFEAEISSARAARLERNEGKARVCARRAAAIAARAYLAQLGLLNRSTSALDVFEELRHLVSLPGAALPVIDHLTTRVNEEFSLPPEIDLLEDARRLRSALFPD